MTNTLEAPPEQKKPRQETTIESPVATAHEMTQEGMEAGIDLVQETAHRGLSELEGLLKHVVGAEEIPEQKEKHGGPERKPER